MYSRQLNSKGKAWQPGEGEMILAQGLSQPFNNLYGGLNDNVLVVGGSGTGKTRSVVRPNLLQATGSYLVSDPKGNLYNTYAKYLRARGYRVERLDFVQPERSTVHYNMFHHIETQTDILKVSHMMTDAKKFAGNSDQFWEFASEILFESIVAYLWETAPADRQNLSEVLRLIRTMRRESNYETDGSFDKRMQAYKLRNPDSYAVKCYENIAVAPTRTWDSIIVSASSKFAAYDTAELNDLMRVDTTRLEEMGERPVALFVVVSDTDRSMDTLANLFFSQAMQILVRKADERPDGRLAVPVRFILDDFATNVRIEEFPRMISSIRSRGISAMLMVQAETQLETGYGRDAQTIISNCDTYLYLGGNDIETARNVGERCNMDMMDILNMPLRYCWVFRRGQAAMRAQTFDLEPFEMARTAEVYHMMAVADEPMTIGERMQRRQVQQDRKHRKHLETARSIARPVAYYPNEQFGA